MGAVSLSNSETDDRSDFSNIIMTIHGSVYMHRGLCTLVPSLISPVCYNI